MYLIYNEIIKSYDLNKVYKYVEEKYDVLTLNSIKEYLKLTKKLEKCKTDIFFITSCLQNNIMPNFTHFKTTNDRLRSQPVYKTCRKLLSTTELSNHKSDLNTLNKSINYIRNNKLFEVTSDDLNSILFILDREILNHFKSQAKYKSVKKLNDLGIYVTLNDLNINPIFVTHRLNNKIIEKLFHKLFLILAKPWTMMK